MELNNSIRKIRKNLGLTQEQFAAELGIKRSLVGAYEEGRAEPRLELLHKMAKLGGLNLENLITNEVSVNQLNKGSIYRLKSQEKTGNIQLVPVKAAAGYLRGFGDEEVIKELPNFS